MSCETAVEWCSCIIASLLNAKLSNDCNKGESCYVNFLCLMSSKS
jgi:hypothetical protein